jgi:hypothetical protein
MREASQESGHIIHPLEFAQPLPFYFDWFARFAIKVASGSCMHAPELFAGEKALLTAPASRWGLIEIVIRAFPANEIPFAVVVLVVQRAMAL